MTIEQQITEIIEAKVQDAIIALKAELKAESESKDAETELLTRQEAASLLKVSLATIDNYVRYGYLKKKKQGRLTRFKKSDIIDFLDGVHKNHN